MSAPFASDFSRIYEDYHGKVLAYASKLVGRDEAEDVSQEVFFKVSQSLGTLTDRAGLTSWIFAITLNAVRDRARRCAARVPLADAGAAPSAVGQADALSGIPDSGARTPEETTLRNEMIACYLGYLRQLPRDYYEVYVLSEFGGFTNPEIARRLSFAVSTVKIRLHRARARLHGQLRRACQCYVNERGELMGEPRGNR